MTLLGNGLLNANHNEDALSVQEAELSMRRRLGASEEDILVTQSNLAITYQKLGRLEEALSLRRDVYSGQLKLDGEEHEDTLVAADNYAASLFCLERYREAKALYRKKMPVARRVLGDSHERVLIMRSSYAEALYRDTGATLNDLREAVKTLEETVQTARRVLGGTNPITVRIEESLRDARRQPVKIDNAIAYVTAIKKRFEHQPETYKAFLEVLHTYQREQKGIQEVLRRVAELFKDHADLLREFTYFLPDADIEPAQRLFLQRAAADAEQRNPGGYRRGGRGTRSTPPTSNNA